MILKLEEEAEVYQDRIKNLQQDLYETINIGQFMKEKELKYHQEIGITKQNNGNYIDSYRSLFNDKSQESGQFNYQMKNLSEQLIAAQEEVQNLKEEMETSEQLKNAKDKSEKYFKENIEEIKLENDRIKIQMEVYQIVLFKLSHILPQVELEQLIKDFISNSELLYQAQIQQEQQESQIEQNTNEQKQSAKDESNNNQLFIKKRKQTELDKDNLKSIVSQCNKLREREKFLLSEIDNISQFEKQRIEKYIYMEREFNKMKSLMEYEKKRNEVLTNRSIPFSPNRQNMKSSNLVQQSPKYSDLQSQRNNFMSSSDLESQKLGQPNKENELKRNERQNSEEEQQLTSREYLQQLQDAKYLKNKLIKQQSFSKQVSSIPIDAHKEKIMRNLLSSNLSIKSNNYPDFQNSPTPNNFNLTSNGKMSSIELQQNMLLSSDKNAFLRMKLEDKLMNSKRNLGLSNKISE